jgi:hypothetical protein
MRRKRYKKGHIDFLALEASTLLFKHIDERVMFHTNRQRYGKVKPRSCDLHFNHRIASYSKIGDTGLLTATYMLTLDPKELDKHKLTSAQVVKNVRKSLEACTANWAGKIEIKKVSILKAECGSLYLWIIFETQIKGWDNKKHLNLAHCLNTEKLQDDAGRLFEIYGSVHYVLMMCMFEYPGYLLNGKVD